MFGNGKVFISHTHEDNAACMPVLAALDAWQVDYWFDTAQLSAGLELLANIQRGLAGRDIFLRICTPAANVSPWMAEEHKLARTLRAPNRRQRRMIDLIVKPGYVLSAEETHDLVIDTTKLPQIEWLRQLREALEVPSRERRVSRRAVLGVGITSLAALGGMGLAGKLLFFTPPAPNLYLPVGHQPTPTALPGAARIRWTYGIDDLGIGSPLGVALAGDTVLCSSATARTLTALNASDGTLRWEKPYEQLNSDAPTTVVGDIAYFTTHFSVPTQADPLKSTEDFYLVALNVTDGSERWRQYIASTTELLGPYYISAVSVAGKVACVRHDQTLFAFDATTGKALWSQSAGKPPSGRDTLLPAPTIAGSSVYAVLGDANLHAFSLVNGAPLWPAPFAGDGPIRTQPVVASGVVYTGADGGWCYALDAATATIHWKEQLLKKPTPSFTSLGLTLSDNILYISGGFPLDTFKLDNALHGTAIQALDPATGKILWPSSPDEQLKLTGLYSDLLHSSPLVVGNSVFVATRLYAKTGKNVNILFALNKQDGKVKWSFQMWGDVHISGPQAFPSMPVASADTLYIASGNETLYAISYAD
ncbi:MAG TPA: toll/interleukin-1 receptor domain-containing protein [Ktedonobacterales bacterium]|nr:toll/interleukin-1 receptor domain-containing protein [Ktedonobacterales bacterium]